MTPSVLVTGASGGFGREFARQLEAMGYRLVLHGRDASRLRRTRDSLRRPDAHRLVLADLANAADLERLVAGMRAERLVGLVNNAGFGTWGEFADGDLARHLQVLQTDLLACVHLTHALLPQLIPARGFIVNVSSLAGETPLPFLSTYAAAKAGLTSWSEALRCELARRGVRVVTLAPGPSPTGFRDVSGMPKHQGAAFRTPPHVIVEAALKCLRRGGGYCVPSLRHRALHALQRLVPRALALVVLRRHLRRPPPP